MKKVKTKYIPPEEAAKFVKSNDSIYLHSNCSFPKILMDSLCSNCSHLENVKIIQLMSFLNEGFEIPGMEKHLRILSLFTGKSIRNAVNDGRADFIPVFLSEIPKLIINRRISIDICFLHLSLPDDHGYCSFGVSNECAKTAAENCRIVIAQLNKKMPRVLGDNFIHMNKIDFAIEVDENVPEFFPVLDHDADSVYEKIGRNVASLIEDGSILQMGIGMLPDKILESLKDKRDLGVHTEMFSDSLVDLIETGIVTGERKSFLPGKIVSSFVLGTKRAFDFLDNNPAIEFRPSLFVNDPFIISRNDKMVSINSALEIDITGQVCADSIGTMNYSGLGGQLDFIRGASRSKDGKPIIAIKSTAKNGKYSRIVPHLKSGAGVTTTRGDIHYVVTEYGIADLWGKTIRERVRSLIDISHPDFRDSLEKYAQEIKYIN